MFKNIIPCRSMVPYSVTGGTIQDVTVYWTGSTVVEIFWEQNLIVETVSEFEETVYSIY